METESAARIPPLRPVRRLLILALALAAAGCATKPVGLPTPLPDRAERMEKGYVYYLDGAGGGTADKNWAEGVKEGILAAGYEGAGEMYSWETGKGLLADQTASVAYKRSKARGLSFRIQEHVLKHPESPVSILGFSAGCAEAVFVLEALPEPVKVDRVVLVGASISQDYDLTEALKRVKHAVYIFTSTKDEMLGFLMKFSGTTDRRFHDPGAGIKGFVLPEDATEETRSLYNTKIVTIPWTKEMKKSGDHGHHFDNVKMEFIRDHVAPLLIAKSTHPGAAPTDVQP